MQGVVDDRVDRDIRETERATRTRGVLFDARESKAVKSLPPGGAGVALGAEILGDLQVLSVVGSTQHDPGFGERGGEEKSDREPSSRAGDVPPRSGRGAEPRARGTIELPGYGHGQLQDTTLDGETFTAKIENGP